MITEPNEFMQRLQELQDSSSVTYSTLPSDEPRFIIDANSRTIKIPPEFQFLGVKNDHKAETIYFEIDRYFDSEDLSTHTCVVQFENKSGEGGIYPVTIMDTESVDGKIIFGWKIMSDATTIVGDIIFSVRFYSLDNYVFTYNFNTLPAKSVILDTLNVDDPTVVENYPSELEAWLDRMNDLSQNVVKPEDVELLDTKMDTLETSFSELETNVNSSVAELKSDLNYSYNDAEFVGTTTFSAYYGGFIKIKNVHLVKGMEVEISLSWESGTLQDISYIDYLNASGSGVTSGITFDKTENKVKKSYVLPSDAYGFRVYVTPTFSGDVSLIVKVKSLNNKIDAFSVKNRYKNPIVPVWGHEYMMHWYNRMYNNLTFKVVVGGDSTTKNSSRDLNIRTMLVARGYSASRITTANLGVDGSTTKKWLENGELTAQLAENPNLLVLGYGLNDGSPNHFPNMSMEARAKGFETRLRQGLATIRESKPCTELSIIITTPISINSDNISGSTATADNWCALIDPIIRKACRDYQCAFADFTALMYDHDFTKDWCISKDGVHPEGYITKALMGQLADLIVPLTYDNH